MALLPKLYKIISPIKKYFVTFALQIVLTCLLFASIEGILSFYHFYQRVVNTSSRVIKDTHTEYDPLLGWINKQNLSLLNLYGPGKNLTTNSHRFRITPTHTSNPAFTTICSGDSFTFGYGVDDYKNWCSLLSSNSLQPYNMAQGGYGIDQNYLWYLRDAETISHTFHIMAFILDDFDRVSLRTFRGYGKPFFKLKNNVLANTNNPVPPPNKWLTVLALNPNALEYLNIYLTGRHALSVIMQYLHLHTETGATNQDSENVIAAILNDLVGVTRKRGAFPIIVLLPTQYDPGEKEIYLEKYDKRKKMLNQLAANDNLIFIDIGESMLKADPDKYTSYFNPKDKHYNESGHALVAQTISEVISQYLRSHPEIQKTVTINNPDTFNKEN